MLYLDANFFIFANFDTTPKGEKARKILHGIAEGQEAVTSVLALDEVMWDIIRNKKETELRDVIEEIYSIKNMTVKEVSSSVPLAALDFMEIYKLKPRDAFHAAVMKQFGITNIVSDDTDFDAIRGIKRIRL